MVPIAKVFLYQIDWQQQSNRTPFPVHPFTLLTPSPPSWAPPANQLINPPPWPPLPPPPPPTFLPTKQPPSLKPTSYQPSSHTHKHTGFCHSPRPPSAVIWSYAVRNLGKQESCLSVCNASAAGGWVVGSCSKINNRIKVMLMIIMEQKRKNSCESCCREYFSAPLSLWTGLP